MTPCYPLYSTQSTATQSPNFCPKCHKPYWYSVDIPTGGTAGIICQCQQSKDDEDCGIDRAERIIMVEHAPVWEALAAIDYIGLDVYQALRQLERINKAAFETVFNRFVEMHKLFLLQQDAPGDMEAEAAKRAELDACEKRRVLASGE